MASTPICSPISSGVPSTVSTGKPLRYFSSPLPCFASGKRNGSAARDAGTKSRQTNSGVKKRGRNMAYLVEGHGRRSESSLDRQDSRDSAKLVLFSKALWEGLSDE